MDAFLTSEKLGERLFEARQARGFGMRKLSQLAHVGEATINDIEKGRQGAATDTVERLALALGVRPAWLAYGDEPREAYVSASRTSWKRRGA